MRTYLDNIINVKRAEVAALKERIKTDNSHPLRKIDDLHFKGSARSPSFQAALLQPGLSVIAEIKRKSPSAGQIGPIADPLQLASQYILGGASAISVLTDESFFGGSLQDLQVLAQAPAVKGKVPLLRKDFIVDRLQIAEAFLAGASAVLLIVAALGKRTGELYKYAQGLGLDVLVEVHDKEELDTAMECNPGIIGINNRNLSTFVVSLNTAEQLATAIPAGIIKVAESGIHTASDAARMSQAGFDAILVGEALVKADDPGQLIQKMLKR